MTNEAIRINRQMVSMASIAASKIEALGQKSVRSHESKAIFNDLIVKFETRMNADQHHLDHINYATMLVKIVQVGSQCAWLQVLVKQHPQFVRKLIIKGAATFRDIGSSGACYALWALGKLGRLIWALASVRVDLNKLLAILVAKVSENPHKLLPIQLEASLRGLSALRYNNSAVLRSHALQRLGESQYTFTDQQAISIVRSAIILGSNCRVQMRQISEQINFSTLTPQNISFYAWCAMKVGGDPVVHRFPQLVEEVCARRTKFGALFAGKILSALASYSYFPGAEFLNWVGSVFALRMHVLSPELLGSATNAFCNLNYMPEEFLQVRNLTC